MAVTCLNCKEVLVEIEPRINPKSKEMQPPRRCPLEEENDVVFYRCPHCSAKNIVAETRTENGFPEIVVVACSLK